MSTEQAFLSALAANPLDSVTRQVYADWLEELGDRRAEYLRVEIEVSGLRLDDPRWPEVAGWLRERVHEHDPAWVAAACQRYDVWLVGYSRAQKIHTIKVIRELTGMGLKEAKDFSESLPRVVASGVVFQAALVAAGMYEYAGRTLPQFPDAGWFGDMPGVAIWPAEAVGRSEPWAFLPPWPYLINLGEVVPEKRDELMAKARAHLGRDFDTVQDPDLELPVLMQRRRFRTAEEARDFLRPFEGLAQVEVAFSPVPPDAARQLPLNLWQGHGPFVRPSNQTGSTVSTPAPQVPGTAFDNEGAFLRHLRQNPLDHGLRVRYYNFLRPRDPRRAEYLLRQLFLLTAPLGGPLWQETTAWLDEREGAFDADWAFACCPRFEVWLSGYQASRRADVIRAVREITGLGLAETTAALEALPLRVHPAAGYHLARRIVRRLEEACRPDSVGNWKGLRSVAELRPCTAEPARGWPAS